LVAPEQLARLQEFKKSFPTQGMWWPYNGKTKFAKLINEHLRKFLAPRISPKPAPLENSAPGAVSQRGLPLEVDDFHGSQELKPSAKSEPGRKSEPERERVWLDMKLVEERAEKLFQSPEFCEIRSLLGPALAAQFIRLLVQNRPADAAKHLGSCGLPPGDVMHLMRVSNEAMDHVNSRTQRDGDDARGPK
jgi:hypothetical protein